MRKFRSPRRRHAALITLLILSSASLAAGMTGSAAGAPSAKSPSDCQTGHHGGTDGPNPFAGVCDYLDARQGVVQAVVFDQRTGRTYHVSNGDDTQYTASIVKADILARWLHRFQKHGVPIPDGIPYSIKYLMHHMIENSDNAAATALFSFGGGCDALTRFNKRIPLDETKVGCESSSYYGWGNTTTTAADQVRLMRLFAYGHHRDILGLDARNFGLQLMQSVEPDQRFGVSCGPWGDTCDPPDYADPDPDVTVALKNGWKPVPTCSGAPDECPWQVNSIGWAHGHGRNYAIAVLTTKDPAGKDLYGFKYGIDTIQNVSKRVWHNLG
jgi:Beta-lactamase enzyme family